MGLHVRSPARANGRPAGPVYLKPAYPFTKLIIVSKRIMTNSPAAETAAFVRAPEMALAMVRPARISVTTSMRTAPSGVLIMFTIELVLDGKY